MNRALPDAGRLSLPRGSLSSLPQAPRRRKGRHLSQRSGFRGRVQGRLSGQGREGSVDKGLPVCVLRASRGLPALLARSPGKQEAVFGVDRPAATLELAQPSPLSGKPWRA